MKVGLPNAILIGGAMICFAEVAYAPKDSDPGRWAALVLAILLLRRAIMAKPQPIPVILSGCFLAALLLAGDHGFLNINNPLWWGLILASFAFYGFWEKIDKAMDIGGDRSGTDDGKNSK